jgi:hypothetical protein
MTDRPKRPRDANQLAKHIVDLATGEAEDMREPQETQAQRSGAEGGRIRARILTASERSRIARKAAKSRWQTDRPVPEKKEQS